MIDKSKWDAATQIEKMTMLKDETERVLQTIVQVAQSSANRDQQLLGEVRELKKIVEALACAPQAPHP